jgi:DNA-binding transcriptional LysR family regulator
MHTTDRTLPPLEGLSALLAAADAGSFSGAADALGLTHGSVSRRIQALERWLGAPLFERHGRGVTLTPAGLRFAAEVRRTLDALSGSAEQWRPRKGRQSVRLSVVPSFARLWLIPRLAELEQDDIRVELALEHRTTDLEAGEADVAVRYGREPPSALRSGLLFVERLTPVAAPSVAARLSDDLLAQPLLHDSDISQWRAWLAARGLRYRPRWQDRRFEDYDAVLVAAASGLGVALLREPLASGWVADGRLRPVSEHAQHNAAAHYVCMRPNEARQAVAILFERVLALGSRHADAVAPAAPPSHPKTG